MFRRPPHFLFHAVLVVTGLVVLWAYSYPGVYFIAVIPCIWVVGIAIITWLIRGATYVRARRRGLHRDSALWFAIAPIGAVALALLLNTNVTLRLRWQTSKSDFRHAVADVKDHPASWTGWHPRRIGTYAITSVWVVDEGIIFYDKTGSFMDDAGFAYLPHGPSHTMANGNFEDPQWYALGDHWYAWTASW